MNQGYFNYPLPMNEPVLSYAPGSNEKKALRSTERPLAQVCLPFLPFEDEVLNHSKYVIRFVIRAINQEKIVVTFMIKHESSLMEALQKRGCSESNKALRCRTR